MQVHKIQNNNTSFGVKLVVGHGMFPRGSVFDGGEKELLQKLVSTVETKTADKKGIVYVADACTDLCNTNNIKVYYKNGKYTDSVFLYGNNEQNLRENINNYIDTLLRLTDVFKMREEAVKTAQKAQKQIEKLEQKVYLAMNDLRENIQKTLPEKKSFSGSLLDSNRGFISDKIFNKSFERDKQIQKKVLG